MPAERGLELLTRMREVVVVGDGAMGTELWRRGFPHGLPPEQANLTAPDLVKSVHRDYLTVGAQVITTNTFAARSLPAQRVRLGKKVEGTGSSVCPIGEGGNC
jgi:methionine synthase I (cobalamin-dependent)